MAKEDYVKKVLSEIAPILKTTNPAEVIDEIAKRHKDLKTLSVDEQNLLGAILGSLLHEGYCNGRKLDKPNEQGLPNNPRVKKLTEPIDQDFVASVVASGRTNGTTLFVEDGVLCMDIANTPFASLSPYWQKDNFMAGCAATRSVMTFWNELNSDNEALREFVAVAIANAIHESWIARENIYYDVVNGKVYTNEPLATSYINLPQDEKDKDLLHYKMAIQMIDMLVAKMKEKNGPTSGGPSTPGQPGDN